MKRRSFLYFGTLAALATSTPLLAEAKAEAKGAGKIGKMDPAAFKQINEEAGAKVAALKTPEEPLSEGDQKLMLEIAVGGLMQLQLSKAALPMIQSADIKIIAQAEIEEQTTLSAKLKEIAKAKKVDLPAEPDEKAQKTLAKLRSLSDQAADHFYLEESGVKGHELLAATMKKVESKAKDPVLKALASLALPLIHTHLTVSRDEMADLGEPRSARAR